MKKNTFFDVYVVLKLLKRRRNDKTSLTRARGVRTRQIAIVTFL